MVMALLLSMGGVAMAEDDESGGEMETPLETVTGMKPVPGDEAPVKDPVLVEIEVLKGSVAELQAKFDRLVRELESRFELAERKLNNIENTLGADSSSHFGGMDRRLDDMMRKLDDIERTVEDVERNQRR
jgi:hypothetical protein